MEKFQDRYLEEVKEVFKSKGITTLLFDFDDTLIYTEEIFTFFISEYIETVAKETGLSTELLFETLERIDTEGYKKFGVNPVRWKTTLETMAKEFVGSEESIVGNLGILMKIYEVPPRIRPGAEAILEIAKRAGIKIALVTHANAEWTHRKLESTGLAEYFDVIKIVDENKQKRAEDWLAALVEIESSPEECLALGNSLAGDILPADEIWLRTMWLHNSSTWSLDRAGNVPRNTVHLDDIGNLLSALSQLR